MNTLCVNKLQESVVQNYIFNLGLNNYKDYDLEYDIHDILQLGHRLLGQLLVEKKLVLYKDNSLPKIVPTAELLAENDIELRSKNHFVYNKPIISTSRNTYSIDDNNFSKIIERYSYKTDIKLDNASNAILKKQNHIRFKIWGDILNFKRKEIQDINYQHETNKMIEAIKNNIDKPIYFGHRFDKRGRLYNDGYLVNYQGDEFSKAAINVDCEFYVRDENIKYIKHDLANRYGLDKLTYEEKEKWVDDNYTKLMINAIKDAKEPIMFAKARKAYIDVLSGKKISYFVSNDSTASGLQILSLLSNDEYTARLTNLTDNSKCYDIYSELTTDFFKKFEVDIPMKAIRKNYIKPIIMTHYYNSKKGVANKFNELLIEYPQLKEKGVSLEKFIEYLNEYCKGPQMILEKINEVFDKLPKDTKNITYTMPDGFIVDIPLISKETKTFQNGYYCVSMMYDVNEYSYSNNHRSLAPNIIHSIDAYIVRLVLRECKFDVVTIHDCFSCSPNLVDKLKRAYTNALKRIQQDDLLNHILSQIDKSYKPLDKPDKIQICENNYAIC